MKVILKASYVFAVLAIIACVISSIVYLCNLRVAEMIGSVSTIISIALSIISMINSCVTENKTSKTLEEIKSQNKTLVDMINNTLSKENYGKANIESLTKNYNE